MNFCWLYRKAIAWKADENQSVPRWVQRHLVGCPDCRRYEADLSGLTVALEAQAAAHRQELTPFLHARILSALDRQASAAAAPRSWSLWMQRLLIPAAATLAMTTFLLWNREQPAPALPQTVSTSTLPGAAQPIEEPTPAPTVPFWSWAEQLNQPLEGEMKSVVHDAKSALAALTDQFVPDVLLARNEQ